MNSRKQGQLPNDMKNYRAPASVKHRIEYLWDFFSPTLLMLLVICAYLLVEYIAWQPY